MAELQLLLVTTTTEKTGKSVSSPLTKICLNSAPSKFFPAYGEYEEKYQNGKYRNQFFPPPPPSANRSLEQILRQ